MDVEYADPEKLVKHRDAAGVGLGPRESIVRNGITMVSESHVILKPNLGVMKEFAIDKYSFYRFGSGGFVG